MLKLLILAVGGALGTLARHGLNGVLAALTQRSEWRDFLMVGLCGGFTTFSSYGIQTLNLARDGEWLFVALNVISSNVLGLVAVYLDWVLGCLLQGGR